MKRSNATNQSSEFNIWDKVYFHHWGLVRHSLHESTLNRCTEAILCPFLCPLQKNWSRHNINLWICYCPLQLLISLLPPSTKFKCRSFVEVSVVTSRERFLPVTALCCKLFLAFSSSACLRLFSFLSSDRLHLLTFSSSASFRFFSFS